MGPVKVSEVRVSGRIATEVDRARTYEEQERFEEETREDIDAVWMAGTDFLGTVRSEAARLTGQEQAEYQERLEAELIAYDEEPGYVDHVLRQGLHLDGMNCAIKHFAFNDGALFDLWSFARFAEGVLLDEVFAANLPPQ